MANLERKKVNQKKAKTEYTREKKIIDQKNAEKSKLMRGGIRLT